MKKLIIAVLMVLGTVTSMYAQSTTGFGFDVTNAYKYSEYISVDDSDSISYESSYIFDMSDSIFIHKVNEYNIIQIYRITDYIYVEDDESKSKSHFFTVQGIGSGEYYYYVVIHYELTGVSVVIIGDDDTYLSGLILETKRSYRVSQ